MRTHLLVMTLLMVTLVSALLMRLLMRVSFLMGLLVSLLLMSLLSGLLLRGLLSRLLLGWLLSGLLLLHLLRLSWLLSGLLSSLFLLRRLGGVLGRSQTGRTQRKQTTNYCCQDMSHDSIPPQSSYGRVRHEPSLKVDLTGILYPVYAIGAAGEVGERHFFELFGRCWLAIALRSHRHRGSSHGVAAPSTII